MDKVTVEIQITPTADGDQAVNIRCRPLLSMHRLAALLERMAAEIKAGRLDALAVRSLQADGAAESTPVQGAAVDLP